MKFTNHTELQMSPNPLDWKIQELENICTNDEGLTSIAGNLYSFENTLTAISFDPRHSLAD